MKFTIATLRRAKDDIARTYAWIFERSELGATRWYAAVREAIDGLANDADQHGLAPEGAELGQSIRQRLFKTRRGRPYRVLYIIVADEVRVLRVRGPGQPTLTPEDISE